MGRYPKEDGGPASGTRASDLIAVNTLVHLVVCGPADHAVRPPASDHCVPAHRGPWVLGQHVLLEFNFHLLPPF